MLFVFAVLLSGPVLASEKGTGVYANRCDSTGDKYTITINRNGTANVKTPRHKTYNNVMTSYSFFGDTTPSDLIVAILFDSNNSPLPSYKGKTGWIEIWEADASSEKFLMLENGRASKEFKQCQSNSASKVTVAQMKACKMAVLNESQFEDLPMVAVSVYPGKKSNHAHFSVRWNGIKADGHCKVSGFDRVNKVKIKQFHDDRRGNTKNYQSEERDGFYWDRHIGKWRDPAGETCHTCTPENGFPNHSSYR
ncbi:MAG: hypothetical protein KAI02_06010 [Gammaproteobacteria bacterium]|nr:hypothetical protein [Gammaproteobacteria bacterium]